MSSAGPIGNGVGSAVVQALDWKDAVETIADVNIALTGEQTLKGLLTSGSRVGVIGQTSADENGIYVSAAGAWARAVDADSDAKVTNGMVFVVGDSGSTEVGKAFVLTTSDPIVLDTTLLTFTLFVLALHASSHEDGGSDPITMANLSHTHVPKEIVGDVPAADDTEGSFVEFSGQDAGPATAGNAGKVGGEALYGGGPGAQGAADQNGGAGADSINLGGGGGQAGAHTVNNPSGAAGGEVVNAGGDGGNAPATGSGSGGPGGSVRMIATKGGDIKAGGTGVSGKGGDLEFKYADPGDIGGGSLGAAGLLNVRNPANVIVSQGEKDGGQIFGASGRNASAILQADSTTKGAALPRMTTAQRDAITTPLTGLLVYNTTTKTLDQFTGVVWVSVGGEFPPLYINDLQITFNTVATVDIEVGECRDSTNIFNILSGATRTASLATSGAAGLDTGAEAADTWYAVHIIADTTGVAATAALLSLSATAPTLPGTHDVFRHVGWIRNNSSSNILEFIMDGNDRKRLIEYQDVTRVNLRVLNNGSATAMTAVALASLVPTTSSKAKMIGLALNTSDNRHWAIAHGDSTLATADQPIRFAMNKDTGGFDTGGTPFDILIDSSQEVVYGVSNANVDLDLFVLGYHLVI